MTYGNQVQRYQETQILSASRGQLVVLMYDQLLLSMRRARVAIEGKQIEARVTHLDRSRAILHELLVTLDLEQGGVIARNLSGIYTFLLGELLELNLHSDVSRLDRLTAMVADLRDAFAEVSERAQPQAGAA
jgi:flagellar protein FliS